MTAGPFHALGRDNSDKGVNKAMTQAYKYMLLQVLCIGDRKDDADDSPAAEADAPAEPTDWFVANGWADRSEHDVERRALVQSAANLSETDRASLKTWADEVGPTYGAGLRWGAAWSRPFANAIKDRIDEMIRAQTTPAPNSLPDPKVEICSWCGYPAEEGPHGGPLRSHRGELGKMHEGCHRESEDETQEPML